MNNALILAGGVGSRMGFTDVPKQFLKVNDKMIIIYCLEKFQQNKLTDGIYVVANPEWQETLTDAFNQYKITKFKGFANPGRTRQYSILEGLHRIQKDVEVTSEDKVIIHDAARPFVSEELITNCYRECENVDGAMPVLPAKDTFYMSSNGKKITSLLNRDELYAGQAPECFKFQKYYQIHSEMSEKQLLKINGSSEIAYLKGLDIRMFQGDERNFKITTAEDLEKFESMLK